MDKEYLAELRNRAQEILSKRGESTKCNQNVYQLLEELSLYQIELEIQNENLIKIQGDLQESYLKYSELYNLAPMAYFTLNNDGLIVDVNQSGLDLLGLKKSMVINRCFSRYISIEYQLLFAQFRQGILKNRKPDSCELKLIRWSGPEFAALLECKVVKESSINAEQFLICVSDITLRKEYDLSIHNNRSKIASIDKMQSMKEQIYALTRRQNSSLTIMSNYINGCMRRIESNNYNSNELLQIMERISLQTDELAHCNLQVRNFSSKSVLRYKASNINHTIHDALSLLQFELDYPLIVDYEPGRDLPSVKIDNLYIQQVIISLARNSVEAMKDANTTQPKLMIETYLSSQHEITVSLLDNGPGFNVNNSEKIFEPYFTTKTYAIGLGLPTSRAIIEKHGGQLTALLNQGGGANFQLTLPCTLASA